MYQHDDGDSSVTLGIPAKKAQAYRPTGLEGWEKATISKIGGYPVSNSRCMGSVIFICFMIC
jgi:hypothetical protein